MNGKFFSIKLTVIWSRSPKLFDSLYSGLSKVIYIGPLSAQDDEIFVSFDDSV